MTETPYLDNYLLIKDIGKHLTIGSRLRGDGQFPFGNRTITIIDISEYKTTIVYTYVYDESESIFSKLKEYMINRIKDGILTPVN